MDQPWVCPSLLVSYGTLLKISWFSESFGSQNIPEINIYVDMNVDAQRRWESAVLTQSGPELTVDSNPRS